ncbi:ube2s-b [Symbiodinium sp. KB8]|nr:ube2s-b [Symbiodinium sp. KB8]
MAAQNVAVLRKVVKEQAALRAEEESDDGWFVLPLADDPGVDWMDFVVEICGPENYLANPKEGESGDRPSPYSEGMFQIHIVIGKNYPSAPPKINFATRVFHPAIDQKEGKICSDFLDDAWKPGMGIRDVLVMVRNLLADPHGAAAGGSAVNQEAVKAISDGLDTFEAKVAEEVSKYACG